MLMLTRRSGQSIRLAPDPALDPMTPVGEFFRDGPIRVHVGHVEGNRVRIGIEAHPDIIILRDELSPKAP
ncbi:MAG: carbon storage regulator [Gammaproteobacteria bacterium]|nr:carbon storage regulator [Gammaproteobacteria bacterium]